jgi:hypothetical protein
LLLRRAERVVHRQSGFGESDVLPSASCNHSPLEAAMRLDQELHVLDGLVGVQGKRDIEVKHVAEGGTAVTETKAETGVL